MKSVLPLIGLLLTQLVFAQKSDSQLLKEAYDEDNPMASLGLISQIEEPESFDDSLSSTFSLTLGIAYGKLGKEDSAFYFLDRSLAISNSQGFEFLAVRAGNAKGLVYAHAGKYEPAIESYQAALVLAEKEGFREEQTTVLGNMGGVYFHMDDYSTAIKYSERSLEIAYELEDMDDISYGHLRLAVAYEEIDSLDMSIFHNNKSSEYAENIQNYVLLTYIEKTLGNIHKKLGRLDSSLHHHERALQFAKLEGERENIASTRIEVAKVHLELGDWQKAEEEANEILTISKENGYPHQAKLAYDVLYQAALKKRNFEKALNERNQYVLIDDSLNAIETKERIAELEIQYETAKRDKKIVEANAEIDRKERFQLFLFIVIGLIVLFSSVGIFLLAQRFRLKKALLFQEIDTLRAQINSIFGGEKRQINLSLEQINEGLFKPLSEREYEILNEAISDKTNGEIAEAVFVSVNTVKTHLKNIYSKLGVSNRKEALALLLAK